MELESKLAAYRAKKQREAKINNLKEKFSKYFNWNKNDIKKDIQIEQETLLNSNDDSEPEPPKIRKISAEPKEHKHESSTTEDTPSSWFRTVLYTVAFLTWLTFYYIFIQLQFGIIYLIVSALFGMYFNTRTGPRDENEVSAYSVFNRNCESIDGTLKAEQFEKEIRFGAQSVH